MRLFVIVLIVFVFVVCVGDINLFDLKKFGLVGLLVWEEVVVFLVFFVFCEIFFEVGYFYEFLEVPCFLMMLVEYSWILSCVIVFYDGYLFVVDWDNGVFVVFCVSIG